MDQRRVRKTLKYRLKPTPGQEQSLELVVRRCCTLYNTALEQRRTWWEREQSKRTAYYQQMAELRSRARCAQAVVC
jgi:hypothetical protein